MQEQDILKNIVVPCELNPLPVREVEIDEFDVRYTANEKMNIQNDTITLNYRLSGEVSPSSVCNAADKSMNAELAPCYLTQGLHVSNCRKLRWDQHAQCARSAVT